MQRGIRAAINPVVVSAARIGSGDSPAIESAGWGFRPLDGAFIQQTIPGVFAAQAARTPDAPAIDDGNDAWTYAELSERADAIAARVLGHAASPRSPAAICSAPSSWAIAALLGVMKSGRPVVCLDPNHPSDWLGRQARALGVSLVLAREGAEALRESMGLGAQDGADRVADDPAQTAGPGPQDAAAIVSTSGSTGEPKGVVKTHASFLNSARYYIASMGPNAKERHALVSAMGLMAAYPPVLGALLSGGSVHPFRTAEHGVEALVRWIASRRVSVLDFSPTLFRRFAAAVRSPADTEHVRILRLSGETIRPSDVTLARSVLPRGIVVETLLGSAEAGLCCFRRILSDEEVGGAVLHSGQALDNQHIQLLDDKGRPAQEGATGRMVVSGPTVSPGYWNEAARSDGALRADDRNPLVRVFISGDYARRLPGGEIEHVGRAESLIKINGVRINPATTEQALAACPSVRDAAVAARADGHGRDRLVAYLVGAPGRAVRVSQVRARLRSALPREALPSAYVVMDALPLNSAGKVDRGALPDPPAGVERPAYRMPRDQVEKEIAGLWERVLGAERVGLDDSFEALGGTSLEIAAVQAMIEATYGAGAVPTSMLAAHDRLQDFATAVACRTIPDSPLVPIKATGHKRPFFFVHALHGTAAYFGALGRGVDADRPFYGLQAVGVAGEAWPLNSIERMAARYIAEIRRVDPTGPYLIGGVCMGGLIAWEMARQLRGAGRPVGQVVLIETWTPRRHVLMTPGQRRRFALRHAWRTIRQRAKWRLRTMMGRRIPAHELATLRRFMFSMNYMTSYRYRPGRCAVPVAIITAQDTPMPQGPDPRLDMAGLVDGPVEVIGTPGAHETVCHGDYVPMLGSHLRRVLDQADRRAGEAAT